MIKHEKIAARVQSKFDEADSSYCAVYRLGRPLEYAPIDESLPPETTWFVQVNDAAPGTHDDFYIWAWNPRTQEIEGWPRTVAGTTHAEALDALGYELIEEEK